MDIDKDLLQNLRFELRRGTLVLSVLSRMNEPKYGYALVQNLQDLDVPIDPNTLYPLLRRLESQGLLESQWETQETKPRKYYHRTPYGTEIYTALCAEWHQMAAAIANIIEEAPQ